MPDTNNKKTIRSLNPNELIKSVFSDRARTNLLKKYEQEAIAWLVQRIPPSITSNALTGIGFVGSVIVAASFVLAAYFSKYYLLLAVPGFMISWFGDSLDGRLAYYRNIPRKRYGFALDITIDWISIILIGFGYIIYAEGVWELFGYGFVVMYGWEMIIALMRYKITEKYSIRLRDCRPNGSKNSHCRHYGDRGFPAGLTSIFGRHSGYHPVFCQYRRYQKASENSR